MACWCSIEGVLTIGYVKMRLFKSQLIILVVGFIALLPTPIEFIRFKNSEAWALVYFA